MTTHDLTFAAFVDESGSNRTEDPGTYILSAAILDHERLEDVRDAMRGLILPGQKKRQIDSSHRLISLPHLVILIQRLYLIK